MLIAMFGVFSATVVSPVSVPNSGMREIVSVFWSESSPSLVVGRYAEENTLFFMQGP